MSVFIIAEAGVNHNGDIALAKKLIDVAVDCGFTDQSHLTRHFKRSLGVTPGAYQRMIIV